MRSLTVISILLVSLLFSCGHADTKTPLAATGKTTDTTLDKTRIQRLIRQTLQWSESKESIDLLPVLTDSKDSICVGFDLAKHKMNLKQLKETNLFAEKFIENYNQLILTLNRKTRNGELAKWQTNELPTFRFANDVDPWCLCQDVPYDSPDPWKYVEVNIIKSDNYVADAEWKWGALKPGADTGWKNFSYKFQVVKENGKWKIAYMQGFDFTEGIKKDGQE
jgi:hypothetical protein